MRQQLIANLNREGRDGCGGAVAPFEIILMDDQIMVRLPDGPRLVVDISQARRFLPSLTVSRLMIPASSATRNFAGCSLTG
jgi:hypothetical protein